MRHSRSRSLNSKKRDGEDMLTIRIDPSSALKGLSDAQQRQVPFAVSKALNTLANKAQAAERARITGEFRLKRKAWNLQGIYISKQDRSSKTSWRVVIQVQSDRSTLINLKKVEKRFRMLAGAISPFQTRAFSNLVLSPRAAHSSQRR